MGGLSGIEGRGGGGRRGTLYIHRWVPIVSQVFLVIVTSIVDSYMARVCASVINSLPGNNNY